MTLSKEIIELKQKKNAVILAHYYVPDEVQEVADYVGDSFYLSKIATQLKQTTIIFAGVKFMGESAKILNPEKRVFMPDATADCPMAHMIDKTKILKIKQQYPDVAIMCYINSTTEIKSYSDVCVTSSNAIKIAKKIPNQNIFFIPDQHLGSYVALNVPEKNIILNDGYCPYHHQFTVADVKKAKAAHPNALFLAHPECPNDVLEEADYIGSTSEIIEYATTQDATDFLIGTVQGVFYELQQKNPHKQFHTILGEQTCHDMEKITLEKIKQCLEEECNEVFVSDDIQKKAMIPLTRMLEMGK